MQSILCSLILGACASLCAPATLLGQVVICPGESIVFEVADDYYGTKTWEYSADGVTWTTVEVTEGVPVSLQPEQAGWYRVRFYDADCDINYTSEPTRFAVPDIDLGPTVTVNIGGRVLYESGMAAQGVTVRAGCGAGISTVTDNFGVFLLEGVTAHEELAHVTVEKEGYFTASRSFIPTENAADAISTVDIILLAKNLAGTVNALVGGTVNLEGMSIQFPANAFSRDGQPYAGPVRVSLNHIDPTSEDLHRQMPGMLMGVMDDEPQLMLSYGMAGVELSDDAGNQVELAPGSLATVRYPIAEGQEADAPPTIPLWWFDEELGYWVEEGEAQREGNDYVGQVAHFSWWNCDVPANFVLLKGNVLEQSSGAILNNAQIKLITADMGTGVTYTNSVGEFSGMVPVGQMLTLQVWLTCGPLGANVLVYEEAVGPFVTESGMVVSVDDPDVKLVMGQLLDCTGMPVTEGYVWANGQIAFCVEGDFQFMVCGDSVAIRGVDLTTDFVSLYETIAVIQNNTQLDAITACLENSGALFDIDGNTYQTVLIGDQVWMAENLKTTRYRNGDPITNATGYNWVNATYGAWCYYSNDPSNDATYGKLYNWYAAANPNICPQGWHIPIEAEWQQLELTLGMPFNELELVGVRGTTANVGGSMKATALWDATIYGPITNVSGFTGLPAAGRHSTSGNFPQLLGTYGTWWSASEVDWYSAWARQLYYNSRGSNRFDAEKKGGYSVRCVKD